MFHLILTACLASGSGDCRPVLLPAGDSATQEDCLAKADRISRAWIGSREGLTAAGTECRETAALEALELQEVAQGIWFRQGEIAQFGAENRGRIANLAVVIGSDSVAVIDAGATRQEGQALYVAIRRLTDKPISHLILTHMHPDHALGASVFAEAGATILASERLPTALQARATTYLENLTRILGAQEMIGTDVAMPEATVAETRRIDLGGRTLILQPVPTAHTDNDLTVRDTATNTFFAGDLIFRGLTPVIDGSLIGWLDWMEGPAPEADLIIPGHGEPATSWDQAVAKQQVLLMQLRDSVRDAIAAGESMSSAVPEIVSELEMQSDNWAAFSETIARDATAAFKELEWE